jgi:muramoyltetrapeptide carboxypeptidase
MAMETPSSPPGRTWRKPKPVRPGDLIGVAAPSAAVGGEALRRGVEELESLGFRVRVGEGATARHLFTAGTVERRLREIEDLLRDDDVAGIVCARGGAGASALLGHLDPGLVAARPKVFVGCSDVTFLHLWLQAAGVVSFHGPMAAGDLARGRYDRDSFMTAVTGEGTPFATESGDLLPLRAGSARGRLLGGCLSILAAAAGTRWPLPTSGEATILFIEDVNEPPYRIDRMLRQLRESGAFEDVVGVVFGDMKGCSPPLSAAFSLEDVILEALEGLDVPIALGLSSGHASGAAVTLPLGVVARLTCGAEAALEVVEPAVS